MQILNTCCTSLLSSTTTHCSLHHHLEFLFGIEKSFEVSVWYCFWRGIKSRSNGLWSQKPAVVKDSIAKMLQAVLENF